MADYRINYSVYGLGVRSNLAIPGLVESAAPSRVDLEIHLGSIPQQISGVRASLPQPSYISPYRDQHGEPISRLWRLDGGSLLRLVYHDRTEFYIDRTGCRVWASWPDPLTLEDTATYLLGPVLGFVLALRGIACLHASVIAVEGKAVALLGPAGAGKSTTAAAFAQKGYPILSDDVAPVLERDGGFQVPPGYPRIRLWPSSVESLYGSRDLLPRITPSWDKRHLDLTATGYRFHGSSLPLSAIYHLAPRLPGPIATIETITGKNALISLIENIYVFYLSDAEFQARAFRLLARLLRHVPIRRVIPSDDPGRIPLLCDTLLDDFRGLTAVPP
jgi:hypothetical protein